MKKVEIHCRLRKGLESEMSQNWEMGIQYPAHCMSYTTVLLGIDTK